MSDPRDDDLLAAEYVLGVLPLAERRAAAQRAEVDGAFAARIAEWEGRLAPLDAATPEGVAPDLLPAIEARLFPAPRRRRWLWAAGAALAASVALAVMLWPAPPPGARLVAGDLVIEARLNGAVLALARGGPAAGATNDYQLWAIGADGVPRSLGLLRGESLRLEAALEPGITLAVSLEPLGGAPGAVPTGPVLAVAVLE